MRKNSGFTLVELLIVVSILAIMAVILIGILNPVALVNKANDSRRKSDLAKVKTAFEEYYNDKGFYPSYADVVTWNVESNCSKPVNGINKYLNSWPCDPKGSTYIMVSDPSWFKIITNLDNKKDSGIPPGWYDGSGYQALGYDKDQVNYGVSSSNINWYDRQLLSVCNKSSCYINNCQAARASEGCITGPGVQCFYLNSSTGNCKDPLCATDRCGR